MVLQHVGTRPRQHSGQPATETCRMIAEFRAATTGFDADQLDFFLAYELVENSDRIRSTAYAGNDCSWELAFGFHDLRAGFAADYGVEIANHGRIGMCAENTA